MYVCMYVEIMSIALVTRRLFLAVDGKLWIKNAIFGPHLISASRRSIVDMSYSTHFKDFKGSSIPSSMRKLAVTKLSPNFREAVS
ncbi:UNVERIFIED_CONTAM: hypothetical protein FKN15_069701 [Acipenser sinensis]